MLYIFEVVMENNYMDDIESMYPYGQFPINHTVLGQEKIKEELKKHNTYAQAYSNALGVNNQNNTYQNSTYQNSSVPQSNMSFDISKLLPLFLKMQSGNMDQSDMLKLIAPMMSGKNMPVKEMMELMNNTPKKSKSLGLVDNIDISSLTKCDE